MTDATSQDGKYIYAIIACSEPRTFAATGIGGRGDRVHTMTVGRLSAVVSDSPVIEYPNTRRNMLAHTAVLEEVMRDFTLLPVRFGTVAPSVEPISTTLLLQRADEFLLLLEQMRGRKELGLKASWRDGVVFSEILSEREDIRKLRDRVANRPADKTHFERIHLGEKISQAMETKRLEAEQRILSPLKPLSTKTRLNKVIGDQMVINAALLIDQATEPQLDQAVRDLDRDLGDRFAFTYVGPVPPYNFVNIAIHW
jgi:hypothetical protein